MDTLTRQQSIPPPIPRFDCLPEEVLATIALYLDALSLANLSCTAKRFHPIANSHLLWRDLTLRSFHFWDGCHELEHRKGNSAFHDWKALYAVRHTANVATEHAIRGMVDEPVGRLARSGRVLEHGYGIKDALLSMYRDAPEECYLAQQYWSQSLLGCVNRSLALEQWNKLRFRSDIEDPTERGLAALDMFVLGGSAEGDVNDTFRRLNEMRQAVREEHPDIDQYSPRTKAITIADFLRQKGWLGIDEGRDYYSIENQFLGLALRSTHRNSLPLITCVIYCYVCRGFDLRAQPCSFPMHVHAVVQPLDSTIDLEGSPLPPNFNSASREDYSSIDATAARNPPNDLTHLYIDPFNTSTPISLSSLQQQLTFIAPQASAGTRASYLLPASPRSLLVRSAHNIIRSLRSSVQSPPFATTPNSVDPISIYDAAYAALYVLVLFPSSADALSASIDDLRAHFAHHFTEDLRNYETHILPLTTGVGGVIHAPFFGGHRGIATDPLIRSIRTEDAKSPTPKLRRDVYGISQGNVHEVKYRIGTVFRHRRQGYIAAIYGWDSKCEMEESWILGNGVDRLGGGRGQPFYESYVAGDRSTRYVAQENVVVIEPGTEGFGREEVLGMFDGAVGRWFRRFDEESGRFVSNLRAMYPED